MQGNNNDGDGNESPFEMRDNGGEEEESHFEADFRIQYTKINKNKSLSCEQNVCVCVCGY
jgi:hypothetical protein